MKRFARALAVTFAIAVLASFVFLVPQKNATAQSGPDVTIASPLPLPVKGNVSATVTGAVAAQQSGNWNVGITGNVPVANPVGTSGSPVPLAASDVDGPARTPFQSFVCNATFAANATAAACQSNPGFVPSGKLLVVEYVSGNCFVPLGSALTFYDVGAAAVGIGTSDAFPPLTLSGSDGVVNSYAVSQKVKLYAGASSGSVALEFNGTDTTGRTFCSLFVSGYLE
jgi:hypothetical protein